MNLYSLVFRSAVDATFLSVDVLSSMVSLLISNSSKNTRNTRTKKICGNNNEEEKMISFE